MSAPPPSPPTHGRPFRLSRFFAISSLLGMAVVTACLFWVYRELTVRHLVEHETRANVSLTRAFANTMWAERRDWVSVDRPRTRQELLADPAWRDLHEALRQQVRGLHVVKIKIYDRQGLTLYSTDDRQVGEDKSANPGFRDALAGRAVSLSVFRETFDAFEGTLANRNLIASYVPVRSSDTSPVEGVFEVYSDVTELLASQTRAQWQVAGIVMGLLGLLYLFLSFMTLKADRIIAAQELAQAQREQQMRHQAFHDSLTGLPNRASFARQLADTLAQSSRAGHACALMFIDLDRFKEVNDRLGHEVGDRLLQAVAGRLSQALRDGDLLFRMGGDEFTVILPCVAGPADAVQAAQRLRQAVDSPVAVQGHALSVGASIGLALHSGAGEEPQVLLKQADAAMYVAKETGCGVHLFSPLASGAAPGRRAVESPTAPAEPAACLPPA